MMLKDTKNPLLKGAESERNYGMIDWGPVF
jgi:hypothetical protein